MGKIYKLGANPIEEGGTPREAPPPPSSTLLAEPPSSPSTTIHLPSQPPSSSITSSTLNHCRSPHLHPPAPAIPSSPSIFIQPDANTPPAIIHVHLLHPHHHLHPSFNHHHLPPSTSSTPPAAIYLLPPLPATFFHPSPPFNSRTPSNSITHLQPSFTIELPPSIQPIHPSNPPTHHLEIHIHHLLRTHLQPPSHLAEPYTLAELHPTFSHHIPSTPRLPSPIRIHFILLADPHHPDHHLAVATPPSRSIHLPSSHFLVGCAQVERKKKGAAGC